jgi:hypothetical protein
LKGRFLPSTKKSELKKADQQLRAIKYKTQEVIAEGNVFLHGDQKIRGTKFPQFP